jgi:xanthine/CO dehydrogenase XdhC/CoxF family maturation factor
MSVLETADKWLGEGRKIALATVIETWGSAPQPVGSQLLVDADGNFEGAVSGGCVEGAVITEAQDMIATGGHKVISFGVADETAWKVGLACGGKIRVLVEAVN